MLAHPLVVAESVGREPFGERFCLPHRSSDLEATPLRPGAMERLRPESGLGGGHRFFVNALLDRIFEAAGRYDAHSVGIAGGVSANTRLRKDFADRAAKVGLPAYVPALSLSTDNAAMIAAAGLRNYHAGKRAGMDLNADASLAL